jgi:hypothetical protein
MSVQKCCSSIQNFLQVNVRYQNLASGIEKTTISLTELFVGSTYALASIASWGTQKNFVYEARYQLLKGGAVLAVAYETFLTFLNPKATPFKIGECTASRTSIKFTPDSIENTIRKINNKLTDQNTSWIQKQCFSRVGYLTLACQRIIKAVKNALIGLVAIPLSLVTVGYYPSVTSKAYKALATPCALSDLFVCTIGFLNPYSHQ